MKGADVYILFPGGPAARPDWVVARAGRAGVSTTTVNADADADATARRLAGELRRLGYAGGGATLAIPAGWCMVASVEAEAAAGFDRKAMLYRLEERLPIAAEEIVADFVEVPGARRLLGVCGRVDVLRPWLDALERAGVAVESVTPAALLAAARAGGRGSTTLLLAERDGVNVIPCRGGGPAGWNLATRSAADVALQVRLAGVVHPAEDVRAFGVTPGDLSSIDPATPVVAGDPAADVISLASAYMAERDRAPRVELRRGPLAVADAYRLVRRPLNLAIAAAAVLLLCVTGGLLVRAHRYDRRAADAAAETEAAFRQAFPTWPMPASVRAVVESEYRKINAVLPATRRGGDATEKPAVPRPGASGLATLLQVLRAVPHDAAAAFQVDRMSCDAERFEMEGRAASAEVVDDLVTSCRGAGLTVTSPQVRRDADGAWAFVLRGAPSAVVAGAGG